MFPEFILSQTDGRPMYLQIIEQIKRLVAIGDWPKGYKLPSIRELAASTKVSVITVKRAYQELEREGIIITQQGKGSFIAEIDNLSLKLKHQEMKKYLVQAISLAHSLGLGTDEIKQKLDQLAANNINKQSEKTHD
ncbi:MAG: GntR family transcriptional regulator [Alcanivoracaceae bacterium]|nr:GntR family transcriptional regulator [Alcanivoracaceae bacterium]